MDSDSIEKSSLLKDSDDQEVFEIVDYTTASEWERFTASIEEILHDWHLNGNSVLIVKLDLRQIKASRLKWQEKSTTAEFSGYVFTVTHHFMSVDEEAHPEEVSSTDDEEGFPQYLTDMMDLTGDFPAKSHCLARWYGLRQFIIISPGPDSDPITSSSRAKLVLSSLSIASNNTSCQIPMFVQMMHPTDKMYYGMATGNGVRTDFEMAHISSPPPKCNYLSGLVDIFKEKLGTTFTMSIQCCVRFTYIISEWSDTLWTRQPPDIDDSHWNGTDSELVKLPFGAVDDPVRELQVSCTWVLACGSTGIETEYTSFLQPDTAHSWSARLGPSNPPICLLSECLTTFLQSCKTTLSIVQILGCEFDPMSDDCANIVSAFDRLTESPVPSLSTVVSKARQHKKSKLKSGPISHEILTFLLEVLFPDVNETNSNLYPTSYSQVPPWESKVEGLPEEHPLKAVLSNMKTCPVDSFVYRLAIITSHIIQSGDAFVAHLLYELSLELRYRWDHSILLPGVVDGVPDLSTCLMNQKLQMLNCCIRKRRAREGKDNQRSDDDVTEEDEFFECEENLDEASEESGKESYSVWDKPEGRLKRFGKQRLLNKPDLIYIPVTQEAAPLTEDRLEVQKDEFLSLGADAEGSHQRAQMMCSALLSDMESFKAANPGAVLADFVRWYSPRDWIEDEVVNQMADLKGRDGKLSARMCLPGNLWQEVWDNAKPVPARRQKRLFDDTREAERIFEWFSYLGPGGFCQELLSVFTQASLCRLAEETVLYTLPAWKADSNLPTPLHCNTLAAQLELIAQRAARLSRQEPRPSMYVTMFEQLCTIETSIARAQSLRLKLLGHTEVTRASFEFVSKEEDLDSTSKDRNTNKNSKVVPSDTELLEALVCQLLNYPDVKLKGGPSGAQAKVIIKLFADARSRSSVSSDADPEEPASPEEPEAKPRLYTANDLLGIPFGKEYILRSTLPYPAPFSKSMAHKLFAVVMPNEFRMAGAVTQDLVFC